MIFGILMVWNVWSFLPKQSSQASLPYSAFKEQVAGGNVSQVRLVGDEVSGTFVRPIQWPAPAESAGAQGTADQPKTGSEAATAEPQKPTTYSAFRSTFPSVVADGALMPLLEAHHVVIDVATA